MTTEQTVAFIKWCTEPIYRPLGVFSDRWSRVIWQAPYYMDCILINENGKTVFPRGTFLTPEELLDYYLKEIIGDVS